MKTINLKNTTTRFARRTLLWKCRTRLQTPLWRKAAQRTPMTPNSTITVTLWTHPPAWNTISRNRSFPGGYSDGEGNGTGTGGRPRPLMMERLREALATLTPRQASCLHARFWEGKQFKEIAEAEGFTTSAAIVTVRNAIIKLQKYYIKRGWMKPPKEKAICTKTAPPKRNRKRRAEVLKEIRQLENRQKILENKQRNEERKARTRRLIERGAILEGIFPLAPDLPGVEVKAFLIALSHLPGRRNWPQTCRNPGTSHKSLVYKGALIHRCRCRAPLPGALRTSSAMGRYTPQTPCAPRAARHPLCVCPAPRSLKYPRRKEVPPIDFLPYSRQYHQAQRGPFRCCRSRLPKRNQADE